MQNITINNVPLSLCACAYKQEDKIFMFPVYGSYCVVDLLIFDIDTNILGYTLKHPHFLTDLMKLNPTQMDVDKMKIYLEYFTEQVKLEELPTVLERSKHNRSLINLVGLKVAINRIPYQCTGQYYTDEQKEKYNVPKFSIHRWIDSCTGRQYMPEYLYDKKCKVADIWRHPLWYKIKPAEESDAIRDQFGSASKVDALVFIRDSWCKCGRQTVPENLFLTDEQAEELENFIKG